MLGIILKRCLQAIPLLLLLSILSFCLVKSLPGDPVDVLLGTAQRDVAPQQLQEMRHELGLDRSPIEQYVAWLSNWVLKGEFGRSYRDGRPVRHIIVERLPATLTLVGSALFLSFTIGTIWGLLMVFLSPRWRVITALLFGTAVFFYSAPSFWIGFLALGVVANNHWLSFVPVLGWHDPGVPAALSWRTASHLLLPALVLSSRRTAKVALFVRASTSDELTHEYVTAALSRGLSRATVLIKHIGKNSLAPIISLFGLSLPSLLGGSVLIETVFGWPGMGRLIVDATFGRNYPVILALVMIYGALVVVSNLVSDLLQMMIDPRTREQFDGGITVKGISKKDLGRA